MDEHFNGAPLLPQNTVDIDTIQSQRFYCEKYDVFGHWIVKGDKLATVFSYRDQQFILPFKAIFQPELLHWLKESAILQSEDAIEEHMMTESGFKEW